MHDAAALDGDGAAHHVVAANADERVDLELGQRRDGVLQALGVARDVAPRGAEEHAAIEVDARDLLGRQLVLFVGVALGEPVEAVVETDRHASDLDGFDGDRADDAVRAGRGTTADDDTDAFDGHGCWLRDALRLIEPRYSKRWRKAPGVRRAASASRSTQAA